MELYKKYRPKTLKGVVGQAGAKAALAKLLENDKLPHAMLFYGPSGCGKTTIARVVARAMDCDEVDLVEMNSADFRGVDTVRDIRKRVNLAPIQGDCRFWIIDECHKLTNDAQNALLKMLEDPPRHAYFVLCTTEPEKLLKTIKTRCTELKLDSLEPEDLEKMILRVVHREDFQVDQVVVGEMVKASQGSGRKALVLLEQVAELETKDEQLAAIQTTMSDEEQAIKLCRCLMAQRPEWKVIAAVLKGVEKEDPEGIRYLMLAYCRTVLLSGGPLAPTAFKIIDIFSEPFYNSKQAGLAAACWEVLHCD